MASTRNVVVGGQLHQREIECAAAQVVDQHRFVAQVLVQGFVVVKSTSRTLQQFVTVGQGRGDGFVDRIQHMHSGDFTSVAHGQDSRLRRDTEGH